MLVCKVCGKEIHSLIGHITKAHKISKNQYRYIYNYEGLFEDEECFRKRSFGNKKSYIDNPERKEKYKVSMDWVRENTEYINKLREKNIQRYKNPVEREKTKEATKKVRSTIEQRKKTSEISKKQFYEGKNNKLIESSRRYSYGKTYFYNGVLLRSKLEYTTAKMLDRLKYQYEYETKKVMYKINEEVKVYLVDFYIPKLNLVIECKYENNINEITNLKAKYTKENGYKFIYITEKDNIVSLKNKINAAI